LCYGVSRRDKLRLVHLFEVFACGIDLVIQVRGEVVQRDALGRLLSRPEPHERQLEFAGANLLDKLRRCELREVVATDISTGIIAMPLYCAMSRNVVFNDVFMGAPPAVQRPSEA
jgi:hypothetical protein